MIKISVILIIKDGEEYIRYLNEYFTNVEKKYESFYIFEYFIYENNSKDNTKKEIKKFYKNKKGLYWCENIDKNKDFSSLEGISNKRSEYMKELRNRLKNYHGELYSDFCLLLDCDVVLSNDLIPKMFNSFNEGLIYAGSSEYNIKEIDIDNFIIDDIYSCKLFDDEKFFTYYEKNKCIIKRIDKYKSWDNELYLKANLKNIVMVSVFDICYQGYRHNKCKNHYYDSLAFVSKEGTNHGADHNKNYTTCLFKNCIRCHNYRKKKFIYVNKKYLLDNYETIRVNSIFGGCSMIKTNIYNKVKWEGNYKCEHIGFCNSVRCHGFIILNPTIKVSTTSPEYRDYKNIEKELLT